jgi:hypothetical protein
MPVYAVPMIEIATVRDPRLDPVMKAITANSEAEAADLAEAQTPGFKAIRDGIKMTYRWTFRQ